MRWVIVSVSLLFVAPALAKDWGVKETSFTNDSNHTLYCFGDNGNGVIVQTPVAPGEKCKGDAMGTGFGKPVFKAPNQTSYTCTVLAGDLICAPNDWFSAIAAIGAPMKRPGHYRYLSWDDFMKVMGNGRVVRAY